MRRASGKKSVQQRYNAIGGGLEKHVPHVYGWLGREDEFIELRLKMRDDGTILAIAKEFGPDGGPMVCFASGYGVVGCLLALDGTLQAGNWKVDKPWSPNGKKG